MKKWRYERDSRKNLCKNLVKSEDMNMILTVFETELHHFEVKTEDMNTILMQISTRFSL